jgi:hypothetical protein
MQINKKSEVDLLSIQDSTRERVVITVQMLSLNPLGNGREVVIYLVDAATNQLIPLSNCYAVTGKWEPPSADNLKCELKARVTVGTLVAVMDKRITGFVRRHSSSTWRIAEVTEFGLIPVDKTLVVDKPGHYRLEIDGRSTLFSLRRPVASPYV